MIRCWLQVGLMLAAASLPGAAAERVPSGLYDLTIETGMPHLEENLRYTIIHEQRCMQRQELASAFPILSHPALEGCRLDGAQRDADTLSLQLVCPTGHGTTGRAVWHLGEGSLSGHLDVRLGGKNMTFFQRVRATRLGTCRLPRS